MKDSIKMVLAIVIFATAACVGLALVYQSTASVIDKNKKEALAEAQKELFPDAASFDVLWTDVNEDGSDNKTENPLKVSEKVKISAEYIAKDKDGNIIGLAVNAGSFGFNADITALVGIGIDGKIAKVKILTNTDTPGLGANAGKSNYYVDKPKKITFYGQFTGMSVNDDIRVQKDGGKVIAITASTISSRAVSVLVKESATAGSAWLGLQGNNNVEVITIQSGNAGGSN
jgi:electron transport complex protein RnfG